MRQRPAGFEERPHVKRTIIWINGAFGSGKTSVADLLVRNLQNSMIFDPEEIG